MGSNDSINAGKSRVDLMDIALERNPFCCAHSDDPTVSVQSRHFKRWQTVVAFAVVYGFILEVMLYSYEVESTIFSSRIIALIICDVLFAVDVSVRFYTSYYDSQGLEISDRRMVVCHSLMTSFAVDVVTLLPTNYILFFVNFGEISTFLTFLFRVNKLLRFYRVIVFFNAREAEIGSNRVILQSFKYALVCYLTLNILSTFWFRLACEQNSSVLVCENQTWANSDKYIMEIDRSNRRLVSVWIACTNLYWAIATTTSVGFGDITAVTMEEKVFSCITMISGICIFIAMALGGMAAIVTTYDQQRATYLHKFKVIGKNLKDIDCGEDLKNQAIGYYEYLWMRRKGEVSTNIYKGLPLNFVAEISYASQKSLLEKAHLFDGVGSGFLRMVSLLIRPLLFLPQQIVVAKGEVYHQMFYLFKGKLEVLSEDDDRTPIMTLKGGTIFGEMNLMHSLPRTATIRAVTHCDLMCLDRRDLHNLLKQYPDISKKLHDHAKERCEAAIRMPECKGAYPEAFQSRKSSYVEPSHLGLLRKSFAVMDPLDSLTSHATFFSHHSFRSKVEPLQVPQASSQALPASVSSYTPSVYPRREQKSVFSLNNNVDVIEHSDPKEDGSDPTREDEGIRPSLLSTTISPDSAVLNIWHKFVLFISIVLAFVNPYMACFHGYSGVTGMGHNIFLTLSYVLDFILFLDIFVNLRTAIATQHGTLTRFQDIVHHYCKSLNFLFDVLCVIPLECFVVFIQEKTLILSNFGFLRLNRVIKVFDLSKEFTQREVRLEGKVLLTRSIKLLLYVLIFSHWVACGLYLMACPIDKCLENSWIVVYKKSKSLSGVSAVSDYIMALYFAIATTTSTGYGDISPNTPIPQMISGLAMVLGLFLYGYCLSVQAATLTNLDAPRVRYYEKYFAIKAYMESHHIELDLQERITNYMKIQWTKYGGIWSPGQPSLLSDLSAGLREDILMENYYYILTKCPVFQELDESFIRLLATKVVSYTFSPGDAIVYAGDFGKEMYMIRKGVCEYLTPNKEVLISEMSRDHYFGDLSMLYKDSQMGTVRAKTHVEVLELSLPDFEEAMKEFPLIQAQFKALMENKNNWLQMKAKLSREIQRLEQDGEMSETSVTIVPEQKSRLRKRRKSSQPSSLVYKKQNTSSGSFSEWNRDYCEPFDSLRPVYRLLAGCLMRRIFLPDGKVIYWWLRVQLLLACVQAMIVPFQAAFMYSDLVFYLLQYTVDTISWVCLYLGLHMAYYDDNGVLVAHPVYTAQQYLKSNFTLDFFGCFPFELVLLLVYHDTSPQVLHFVSLLRLTRLLQLYRLPLAFSTYESRIDVNVEGGKSLKFIIYVCIFNNILTCLLYLMACPPTLLVDAVGNIEVYTNKRGDQCINGSWIYHAEQTVDVGMMYTITLYWGAATSLSVGYGDITAHSNVEMLVSLVVMIAGVLFYGYIIASIAASLANADTQRAEYHEKVEAVNRYMAEHEVWHLLKRKVVKYYHYLWQRTQGVNPKSLFEGLPIALWEDITCSLYQQTLSKISWFKDTDRSFLKTLSRHVHAVIYRKGDYICRKSDVGTEVFFIKRGVVDVVSEDGGLVFESLTAGQSFGEDAWLFKCTRQASIRARTNCDLFMLTKEDLDFVLESYPYLKGKITKIAQAELNKAKFIDQSNALMDKYSEASQRRETSIAFRSARLEDLKRVDPESGGQCEEEEDEAPVIKFKAKPRKSLAGGTLTGLEGFNVPPGLKELQKRMSMAPQQTDFEDLDSLRTESSGMIVPAVTQQRPSPGSETEDDDRTPSNSPPQEGISHSQMSVSSFADHVQSPENTDSEHSHSTGSSHDRFNALRSMLQPKSDGEDVDSVRTESSGMLVPAVTRQRRQIPGSPVSETKDDHDRSPSNSSPQVVMLRTESPASQQDENKSDIQMSVSSFAYHGQNTEDTEDTGSEHSRETESSHERVNAPRSLLQPESCSGFSLCAPSHASMLCSGVHFADEPVERESPGLLKTLYTFTVHPYSWAHYSFSQLMCLCGFLSCWLIIYQAAFQDHNSIILALNYIIDLFYIAQIFIKFHLCFYDEDGDLIEDLVEIRRHYINSKYSLALDLVSAAPLEILAITAPSGYKMTTLSFLRLLRLSRLYRVYEYFQDLEHQLNVNMLPVRLCKFIVFVTLTVHLSSCLWYLAACPFGKCKQASWIGTTKFETNVEAYVTSMYWCLATVTSTGYGDISPQTESEVWVSIMTMVLGKFMFGIVLANIASTLANAESERVNYDGKLQVLTSYMSDQEVPIPLQHRVREYFNYIWRRNRGREGKDLFGDTPSALRGELLLNVMRDMLESIPLFEKAEDNFLRQIAQKVNKVIFLPKDFIAIKGDMGRRMYYIYRGEVKVVNEEDPELSTILSKGDLIGEVSLVHCVPRRVTLQAVNHVDLFWLAKDDLDEVLENFPDMKAEIQRQAHQRFHHVIDALKRMK